jgi:hypothetical protein
VPEDIDVNRFPLVTVLVAANAKRPADYPDYETLSGMSDSDLLAYAEGLLSSLEHLSSPKDEVAAEVKDGLRRVIRGDESQVELHVQRASKYGLSNVVQSLP